jgi:addiction module HigA family antidote
MSLEMNYEQWGYGPPHPGEVLREQILPRLGIGRAELARGLDIRAARLADLLTERRPVSLDMARRLGKAFGNGARYWLALQMQHDVWKAEQGDTLDIAPITVASIASRAQAARAGNTPSPAARVAATARR